MGKSGIRGEVRNVLNPQWNGEEKSKFAEKNLYFCHGKGRKCFEVGEVIN